MLRLTGSVLLAAALLVSLPAPALSQVASSRITRPIDEGQLQRLRRNTHPLARPEFDQGPAPADLPLVRMLLVLTPSSDRQIALGEFLKAQQDKASPQYHQWLTPQQFGERFGTADSDIKKVTGWLQSHGFQVGRTASGRNIIEFSGTAGQVLDAFHAEIHKYVVNGKEHWANSSDPQIPAARAPVVAGVSTLHNFRKTSQITELKPNAVQIPASGSRPEFTSSNGDHALSPNDFGLIYGLNSLWSNSISGSGATIAVVARTNINTQDLQDFQTSFGVPNNLPQIVVNGTDPGDLGDGDEAEAVLDVSWSGALAPAATVKLVVSKSTNTTDGVDLSEEYIVDNNLADVMTESYGDCEANYTAAEGAFYSSLAQQAAAQGITYTVASGDSGAEGCDDPSSVTVASGPISVNILASTPYDLAVGGTQFNENGNDSLYWNSTNDNTYSSALAYIPEVAWNESCLTAQCGSANAGIWAGSGGASVLFSKPSWQSGVAGIPDDGARDVPDISFTSASHDFYLLCLDGSCTTKRGRSYFSGVSGTSAATPAFAAIMALLVQSTGSRQGQATPTLYALAANQNPASCNSANITTSSLCIFDDVIAGNNAVPGEVGYGTSTASYQAGVGYDLATGLGSVRAFNLIQNWKSGNTTVPQIRIGIESPSAQNATVIGPVTFSGWALADNGSVTTVAIAIDSVPQGIATYGASRPDICVNYPDNANCPNVGWSYAVNTFLLANGNHSLDVTVTATSGQTYTASSNFIVANWTSANPMRISIDTPSTQSAPFSGTAYFGGWALNDISAISQVAVTIDGASYGTAQYGGSRTDVCSAFPGRAGCPNVGWNFTLDTTQLPDGNHTLAITATSAGGQSATTSTSFQIANDPANVISVSIDQPNAQSTPFSGGAGFGGWAITTSIPISSIAVTIDGVSYGTANYGGDRSDVCAAHPNRPSCPNVGWNFFLDTTQLPNGMHTFGIKAYASNGQYASANSMFTVKNAQSANPIAIAIDQPSSQNSIVLGSASFSGWAIDSAAAVSSVAIAIDGVPFGNPAYGTARPDVCAVYTGIINCPNVGWNVAVDTTMLPDGQHTLTVTAIAPPTGAVQQGGVSTTFTVANWTTGNPMKLSIDSPNSQTGSVSGVVGVGGWAIDQLAAITNVSVAVDGLSFGMASYGGTRSDVCAIFTSAIGCPNIGWNFSLDTSLLTDGGHTLAVTGTTAGGQSATFSTVFQVANGGSSPVKVSIDSPSASQALSQISPIGGWALDTNGAQIVSVLILVDGVLNGTAQYGGARADVCAHYSTTGGCPDVGWNYELDTTGYANGNHLLEVRALGADGQRYTASQTFTVSNQP